MEDNFTIANKNFNSRLIVGTGKYKNFQETAKAVEASEADIVTVAIRRVNILDKNQPILIGTTSVENSELISSILKKQNISHSILNAKHHEKEAEIIEKAGLPGNVTISTNMAGRGTDIKLGNNDQELKNKSIDAGGLLVIGTERHESRRIDNQLRGRSGRQGDIGESIFFLSLEDDLMRIFGSKTLENVLSKLGLKKGEAITHSLITRSLERAQTQVRSIRLRKEKQLLADLIIAIGQ